MRSSIAQDIQNSFRILRRNPGSTIAAFSALTLAIGATTTMFSVLSSLMLAPLPVDDSAHLVRITGLDRNSKSIQISMPDALDLKRRLHSTVAFAFYRETIRNLADGDKPLMVHVMEAEADLFRVMSVHMTQGRAFGLDANLPGHACEAVVSWQFWQSRFGGGAVSGQTIRLNERPCRIDGVLPKDLDLPVKVELWAAAPIDLHDADKGRRIRSWYALAHLKREENAAGMNAELATLARDLSRENPTEDTGLRLHAVPLREWLTNGIKQSIVILFAAVLGVLLMACSNVANLLLARAPARMREISVRMAVGAARVRLFQQFLTESLLLAAVSSLCGLALTGLALRIIRGLPNTILPRPESIVLDWRVVLFSMFAAGGTGILFGTLPAMRMSGLSASGISLTGILTQAGGRITETRRQQVVRRLLVGAESATATVLLTGSLLLIQSLEVATRVDPGFETGHLLTAYLSLPLDRYGNDTLDSARLAQRIVKRLSETAGVQSATLSTNVPLQSTFGGGPVQIEGQASEARESGLAFVVYTGISPGFRRTLKIPLLTGRDLDERDDTEESTAILVNATFARTFFPGEKAEGKRVRYNPVMNASGPWQQIAGVIGDTRQDGVEDAMQPEIYIPLARKTGMFPAVVIRTTDNPALHLHDLETAVHEADSEIPVFFARTMEQVAAMRMGARQFNTALFSSFAILAVLLAALGTFAVIAYSVSQRTSEIGLRVACGASRGDIVWMIVRQGAMPALAGIGVGAWAAFILNRYLAGLLYGVAATDPRAHVGAVLLLALVCIGASLLPALRAARINPWRALRYE